MVFVAKGVAGADILETYTCTDIAATDFLHRVLLVGVHLEKTRNTFLLVTARIEHIAAGNNITRINAEEAQTAYIGVGGNLERKGAHRSLRRGIACLDLLGIVDSVTFYSA